MANVVQPIIESKLTTGFTPAYLSVENESYMHSVPPGSESHFKVVIVSDQFTGKRLVQRHQTVYQILKGELDQGIHALAIHAYTPEEWEAKQGQAPESPQCKGGSKT